MKLEVKEFIGGLVGGSLGAVGTATQTNEVLQTISLIITIVGAIISMILVPLVSWYQRSKADGKITKEEIQEGIEIIQNGVNSLQNKENDKEEKK